MWLILFVLNETESALLDTMAAISAAQVAGAADAQLQEAHVLLDLG
jgi:hypothetical protein